jgi:hypothetical protein
LSQLQLAAEGPSEQDVKMSLTTFLLKVLASFSYAQRFHFVLVFLNEISNPILIRFTVFAEAPPDRFVDEELVLSEVVEDYLFQ